MSYFVKWLHCVQGKNEPSLSAIYAPPFFHFKKKEMSQWNYKGKKPCQHPLFNYSSVPKSGILFRKLFWPTVRKIVLLVREKPLRLLEQWNVRTFFEKRICTFLTCYWRYLQIKYIGTIKAPIGRNDLDVEITGKS